MRCWCTPSTAWGHGAWAPTGPSHASAAAARPDHGVAPNWVWWQRSEASTPTATRRGIQSFASRARSGRAHRGGTSAGGRAAGIGEPEQLLRRRRRRSIPPVRYGAKPKAIRRPRFALWCRWRLDPNQFRIRWPTAKQISVFAICYVRIRPGYARRPESAQLILRTSTP
jgi:hypothetical protein